MVASRPEHRSHFTRRLEAFSDIVFGFSLAQLALQLQLPARAEDVLDHPIRWVIFFGTFGLITLFWLAHYRMFRLAFEPEPGMLIDRMDRFAELRQRVDHPLFGLTIDIGHLHCQGELPIGDHMRRWRDLLWNVHIEDMRRGVHDHLMFGEGEIDFGEVMGTLKEIGYAGGVHVELSSHSHDAVETARRAQAFLRRLAEG